jgi:hypothetical protein
MVQIVTELCEILGHLQNGNLGTRCTIGPARTQTTMSPSHNRDAIVTAMLLVRMALEAPTNVAHLLPKSLQSEATNLRRPTGGRRRLEPLLSTHCHTGGPAFDRPPFMRSRTGQAYFQGCLLAHVLDRHTSILPKKKKKKKKEKEKRKGVA